MAGSDSLWSQAREGLPCAGNFLGAWILLVLGIALAMTNFGSAGIPNFSLARSARPPFGYRVAEQRSRGIPTTRTAADSDHLVCRLRVGACIVAAIEYAHAWVRGEVKMMRARAAGGHAKGAARDLRGAARHAAYAAGQAGVVAHVAAHELGAAAYAIKAARAAAPQGESEAAGRRECQWQRDQLPEAIRELVLDDQRLRNDICWSVFDC
ncbi:hypothetical protein U9R90_16075 [Streptomyces sp. E11-3]|uniref:putative immunity protein n=1 Tax=Streptomyces sp. E11-3 TaxID=3110112 RepID=UPI00397F57E7